MQMSGFNGVGSTEFQAEALRPAIQGVFNWIRKVMLPAADGHQGVWERVRIDLDAIQYWVRPDCSCETARGLYLLAQLTGNAAEQDIARNLLSYVKSQQLDSGAFPFYTVLPPAGVTVEGEQFSLGLWPNDNGKVLGVLTEMATNFPELELEAVACRQGDFFLANQNDEGWWRLDKIDYPGTCFVVWPLVGLARLWRLTGKEAYRAAALKALAYLKTLQLPDGRMKTSYEINQVENWRPVSSECAMGLYAFAAAQQLLGCDLSAEIRSGGDFLLSLVSDGGAIRNCNGSCLEASEQSDSNLADMVYTNGYGLMAWHEAYKATGRREYREAAVALAGFLAAIRCQGENPLWDGAWRGSYDVVKGEWNGRADQHNPLDEGGMYSVYTGWCNMPIATGLLLTHELLRKEESGRA